MLGEVGKERKGLTQRRKAAKIKDAGKSVFIYAN